MHCQHPFETLSEIDLKSLSFKPTLLLELSTARQVIEMHISSPDLLVLSLMFLTRCSLFLTLWWYQKWKTRLIAGSLSSWWCLALHMSVERWRVFRTSNQPFVSLVLSHVVKHISQLTWRQGVLPPRVLRSYLTGSVCLSVSISCN